MKSCQNDYRAWSGYNTCGILICIKSMAGPMKNTEAYIAIMFANLKHVFVVYTKTDVGPDTFDVRIELCSLV